MYRMKMMIGQRTGRGRGFMFYIERLRLTHMVIWVVMGMRIVEEIQMGPSCRLHLLWKQAHRDTRQCRITIPTSHPSRRHLRLNLRGLPLPPPATRVRQAEQTGPPRSSHLRSTQDYPHTRPLRPRLHYPPPRSIPLPPRLRLRRGRRQGLQGPGKCPVGPNLRFLAMLLRSASAGRVQAQAPWQVKGRCHWLCSLSRTDLSHVQASPTQSSRSSSGIHLLIVSVSDIHIIYLDQKTCLRYWHVTPKNIMLSITALYYHLQ